MQGPLTWQQQACLNLLVMEFFAFLAIDCHHVILTLLFWCARKKRIGCKRFVEKHAQVVVVADATHLCQDGLQI